MATRVDEDIGGFDVSMHNVVFSIEIRQASESGFCNLAKDIDSDRAEDS